MRLGEHRHGPPRRRHRAAALAPRHRALGRVRAFLGIGARPTYAERHPARVAAVVVAAVSTGTAAEIDWLTVHAGRFFPAAVARVPRPRPGRAGALRLVDAYHELLMDPDPVMHDAAATWRGAAGRTPTWRRRRARTPNPRYDDPRFRLGFARQVTHCWRHNSWLGPDEIVAQRRAAGRDPGVADPRPTRREQPARCAVADPPGLAGQRADHRRRRRARRRGMITTGAACWPIWPDCRAPHGGDHNGDVVDLGSRVAGRHDCARRQRRAPPGNVARRRVARLRPDRPSSENVRLSLTPSVTATSTSPSSTGTSQTWGSETRSPRARPSHGAA